MGGGVILRRDLVMGAACLGAAGLAYKLKPRNHVSLVGELRLQDAVPATFGSWISRDVSDPVALNAEDSLTAHLYNQIVTRLYANTVTRREVVVLLAYGAVQTDDLQLHRPEVCYPAFGFAISQSEDVDITLPKGVTIPGRRLVAEAEARKEEIVYWTRIGEYMPRNGNEQRKEKLLAAVKGVIPDGILCRFSTLLLQGEDDALALRAFAGELVLAMAPARRKALIGTERARALTA